MTLQRVHGDIYRVRFQRDCCGEVGTPTSQSALFGTRPLRFTSKTHMIRGITFNNSAVATMVGVLLVASVGMTAQALTCAPHPSASPQAVAERTESLSVEGSFSDHYDGAIFGSVVSQRTNHDGESADYGQTEVVVDVTGSYGPPVDDPAVVLQDDPGWLNGFPFEVGIHYFIPYVETTDGLYSHLCDPISVVAESEVEHLMVVAEAHGWGVVAPNHRDEPFDEEPFISDPMSLTELGAGIEPESALAGADADDRAARSFNTWLTLGIGLAAVSILALPLIRRREGEPDRPAESAS